MSKHGTRHQTKTTNTFLLHMIEHTHTEFIVLEASAWDLNTLDTRRIVSVCIYVCTLICV